VTSKANDDLVRGLKANKELGLFGKRPTA
jgi:hypothetical protein